MKAPGLVLLATLSACGYSTRTLFDPDIQTVAVNVFKNETFRRDLELDLTRKVAAEVRLRTPWRITSRRRADAVLTGRILEVQEVVLSEANRDIISESSVVVTVEAELIDRATGRVRRKVRRTSSVPFLIPRGESLATALDRSLSELAEDIVQGLEDWS